MGMQNTFINCFELILTMNKLQYNCKQNERGKERKFVKSYRKIKDPWNKIKLSKNSSETKVHCIATDR